MEFRHSHFSLSTTFLRWTDNFQFIFVKNVQNSTSLVPALHFTVYYTTYKWLKWSKLFKNTWSDVFSSFFMLMNNISTSQHKIKNWVDSIQLTMLQLLSTWLNIHSCTTIEMRFKKITAVVIKCCCTAIKFDEQIVNWRTVFRIDFAYANATQPKCCVYAYTNVL